MKQSPLTCVQSKFICETFKISKSTLTRWVTLGCPKLERNLYSMPAVLEWFLENIYETSPGGNDAVELESAKLIFWQAKGRREGLRAAKEAKELIPAAEVEKDVFACFREARNGFQNIAPRIAALVAVEPDRFECEKIIQNEIDAVLENSADAIENLQFGS